MKKTTREGAVGLTLAVAILAMAAAPTARAQAPAAKAPDIDKLVELMRKDVRGQKADIIGKTMSFDATQAAAFWPVYKAYEGERQALGNERLAVIQDRPSTSRA